MTLALGTFELAAPSEIEVDTLPKKNWEKKSYIVTSNSGVNIFARERAMKTTRPKLELFLGVWKI